jgi:ribose transport system permease protein
MATEKSRRTAGSSSKAQPQQLGAELGSKADAEAAEPVSAVPATEPTPPRSSRMAGRIGSWAEPLLLPALWGLIIIFFMILPQTRDSFTSVSTYASIFGTQAPTVVLTLALVFTLTAGDYDLSVAYNLTLSSMLIALLNGQDHLGIGVAVVLALALGALIGLVNGLVTVIFAIDPFIVTLGTGTVIGGVVLAISGSSIISGVSTGLENAVISKHLLGFPPEFYYAILLALLSWYSLIHLPIGRRLLYVGQSRDVARLSGVNVGAFRIGAFVLGGLISAFAGMLYVGNSGAADPTSGTTLLLPAFAAAFLGSTTITPGRFNAWGSVVAVYFLATGVTGLEILGISSFVQDLFYGGALVIAVVIARIVRIRRTGKLVRNGNQ